MINKNGIVWLWIILLSGMSAFAGTDKANNLPVDSNSLIAHTTMGKLRGAATQGIMVWKGIPYAKAPVGELRFREPVAAEAWTGVKDALQFGAVPPQQHSMMSDVETQSEDCLFLNIWSPAADGKKRPVLVWIYGGGFLIGSGSSPLYDGTQMAKNGDVVIVTINYRLGALGFLYFNEAMRKEGLQNNLGIKDQIAALQWVKDNIAAFGGDAAQVTIFGESAGGSSVATLMATEKARGLFSKAIVQSGPASIIWNTQTAKAITAKYLSLLGIKESDIAQLKALPLDTLKAAQEKLVAYMTAELNDKIFNPTIDGELLRNDIFTCFKTADHIPLLIGTNLSESSIFAKKALGMMPSKAAELQKYFDDVIADKTAHGRITSAYKRYPRKQAVLDIVTDAIYRVPAIRMAECHMNNAPVYMYRFEWTAPMLNMLGLHSFHGLEIPFVFGNIDQGKGKLLKWVATKRVLNRLIVPMQNAWINFARYGDPNGKGNGLNWQPYNTKDRSTMILNRKSKAVADPDAERRKAWEGVKYY